MRHSKGEDQTKIIITVLGITMFIAVVSSGYRAITQSSPEIANNCLLNAELESVENRTGNIASQEDARKTLMNITGLNATFISNTIDACDVTATGYVFKGSDNTTYAVCGDGKISKYKDVCGKTDRWSSMLSLVGSAKKGADSPSS